MQDNHVRENVAHTPEHEPLGPSQLGPRRKRVDWGGIVKGKGSRKDEKNLGQSRGEDFEVVRRTGLTNEGHIPIRPSVEDHQKFQWIQLWNACVSTQSTKQQDKNGP